MKPSFTIGDRVRGVRSVGTIKAVDRAIVGRYYVLWDGCSRPLEADGNLLRPEHEPIPQVILEPRKPREVIHRRAGAGRPQKYVERHCATCNKRMERKRYNSRLESIRDFLLRKYCSKPCHSAGMSEAFQRRGAEAA